MAATNLPRGSRRRNQTHRASSSAVEALERRVLLSAVSWTGKGDGTNWTDPNNWSTSALPGAADDVTIPSGFSSVTLSSGTQAIHSLAAASPLNLAGGTLADATTANNSAVVTLSASIVQGGTWSGVGTLVLQGGILQGVTLGAGAVVNGANASTTITGGLTLNSTTLTLGGSGMYGSLTFQGTQTLGGSGTIMLAGDPQNGRGNLSVQETSDPTTGMGIPATLTIAAGITVHGSQGTIQSLGTDASLINDGTIAADVAGGTINLNASPFTNAGTLQATNGGTLNLGGAFTTASLGTFSGVGGMLNLIGTLDNTNTTLALTAATGPLGLSGTIMGGTITAAGGADLLPRGGILAGVTLGPGSVMDGSSGSATITGGLTLNSTTLTLGGSGMYGSLTFQGTQTLGGSGTIMLAGDPQNGRGNLSVQETSDPTTGMGIPATLTIAAGITVHGSQGTIQSLGTDASLINDGTIAADVAGGTINLNASPFTNAGTLQATNGGTLKVQSCTNFSSNTLTGGTWKVSGSSKLVLPGTFATNAATIVLDGAGSIITDSGGTNNALNGLAANAAGGSLLLSGRQGLAVTPAGGTFTNDGTLNVGAGSTLGLTGAFIQQADGTLSVQINGAGSANFGQVLASGAATAGGTLQGSFGNAFDPDATQTFAILNGASEAGTFSDVAGATPGGRTLRAHYNATSVLIAIAPLAPSTPVLTAASDSGISQSDGITNVSTPTFTGTASDAGTVQLYSDGAIIGTATVVAGGAWSVQSSALADGHHGVTAAVLDTDGDLGPLSTGPSILIDTIAPTIHAMINSPASSGWFNLASGPSVVHYVASDNAGGSGLAMSVPASHTFMDGANQSLAGVTISDVAGNTATSESFSGVNQDTVAPTIHAVISAPGAGGWYNIASGPAVVHYTASDNSGGSGLASTTPADYVFSDGFNQSLAGVTISDVAGNTSTSDAFTGIKQDRIVPTSSVAGLPASETSNFTVNWSGQDNAGGSGIANYTIYASVDGGAFAPWMVNTTANSAMYTGMPGHSYGFFSAATDRAGNQEAPHPTTDATTMVPLPPAPVVGSFAVNDGAAQRSMVNKLSVSFSTAVTLATNAITLATKDGTAVPFQLFTADGKTFILTFTGSQFVAGSLADGQYVLTVHGAGVTDTYNQPIAADQSYSFFRLFGDYDGNGTVNSADYFKFKAAFGSASASSLYNPDFDFDGNGKINSSDYFKFKANFGRKFTY